MNIKKASALLDLTPDTIRYYERIGLVPPLKRDKNGVRTFEETDLNWLEFVKCMHQAGLSIEALHDYIQLTVTDDPATIPERKQILRDEAEHLQAKIEELQATLNYLNTKIEHCEAIFLEGNHTTLPPLPKNKLEKN